MNVPVTTVPCNQSSREELINLSQDIHSDVTKLMRSYAEGRDKLRTALEENRQRQKDSSTFDISSPLYGQQNKV